MSKRKPQPPPENAYTRALEEEHRRQSDEATTELPLVRGKFRQNSALDDNEPLEEKRYAD